MRWPSVILPMTGENVPLKNGAPVRRRQFSEEAAVRDARQWLIPELLPKLEKAFETVADSSGLIAPVRVGGHLYRSPELAILVIPDAPEFRPAADDLQRHACCKTVLEGLEHDHVPFVGDFAGRKPPQRCGQTCPGKISCRGVAHSGNLLPEFAPVPHREKRPGLNLEVVVFLVSHRRHLLLGHQRAIIRVKTAPLWRG